MSHTMNQEKDIAPTALQVVEGIPARGPAGPTKLQIDRLRRDHGLNSVIARVVAEMHYGEGDI